MGKDADEQLRAGLISIKLEKKSPMELKPLVIINENENEFRWRGHLFVKGLFDGEHYFQLSENGQNQTILTHGENFSGIMSGVLLNMIGESTLNGFKAMNEALKFEAEKN